MSRDISTCSRGTCRNIASRYCSPCNRAFCAACWPAHQESVHRDDALEAEVTIRCLEELHKLKQVGARRVLKGLAKKMGLKYLPGTGRIR